MALDSRAKEILKQGDKLFEDKRQLDSLWQEIAWNFYPERANFTTQHSVGEEFNDHNFASYPLLARRELGNMLSAALRPRTRQWFSIHVDDEELDEEDDVRAYLEYITDIQRRAMYDPVAGMVKATKATDHDFVAFGNGVIKYGPNAAHTALLYQNHHLRDCVWSENAEGIVDVFHRNWNPTARQLDQMFSDKVSDDVKRALKDTPEKEFLCRHVIMPSRLYHNESKGGRRFPFTSLYVERESETVLEETGLTYFCYIVPRWHVVSGSQYGRSMATEIALPDGRTMQVVTRTLREAGEKYVDPPMIAVTDAIRSDIALYAGGITTADMEYDEKTGEVLRPITQDRRGFPIGFEINEALKEDLNHTFFLDKIQLPETDGDKTAFEIRRRIEEQIRAQAPLYEPVEEEYNVPLCEGSFNVLRDHGVFPIEQMPESIQGADIKFEFRSPLADLADQAEAGIYEEVMETIVRRAAELDPAQLENVDLTEATRDAMRARGFKQKWFKPKDAVDRRREELRRQQEFAAGMEAAQGMGELLEKGKALSGEGSA